MQTRRHPHDAGFSMVEVLVTIVVIALLAAAVWPVVRSQQHRGLDHALAADLARVATAADAGYSSNLTYPTTTAGFSITGRGIPAGGAGNSFRAFVIASGANAGYVVYGRNDTTGRLLILSSWSDGAPIDGGLSALPLFPPTAGQLGIPAGVTSDDWASTSGTYWGRSSVQVPTEAAFPVMPFADPSFKTTVKDTPTATALPHVLPYFATTFRVVGITSPVATRAVEVVADGTTSQGVIMLRAPTAGTWPASQPKVAASGERWTVSAFVKAPSGTAMRLGCRYTSSAGSYVSEATLAFVGTGTWQRPVNACPATTVAQVGSYVNVEVYSAGAAAGTTFYVTAPQVNAGTAATAFKDQ